MINLKLWYDRIAYHGITLMAVVCVTAQTGGSQEVQNNYNSAAYHGFSQPWELIEVAVAEPGRVDEVSVHEGDSVLAGALIARLENAVLKASLEVANQRASAGGEEQSARARLNHAARRRDDIKKLLEESHASQTELDQADLALQEAQAALLAVQERQDVANADVARIQAELDRREIRAPIDGVVIELNRRKGEYAGAADHVIAKVAVLEKLRLRINVPTSVAVQTPIDSQIQIEFPEIHTRVPGYVDFVSPVTDSQSGTVRVDIRLDNRDRRLRSGLLGVWRCPISNEPIQGDENPTQPGHPEISPIERGL